ncbi:MAG: VOC family protein [Rhodospirillaceae bacterium]|nr:VOC family protein [Rhodospirillaceae bacterium]
MTTATNTTAPFTVLGLDHVVLRVRDMDTAKAFYCGLLGCTVERAVDDIGLVQLRAGASLIDLVDVNSTLGKQGGAAPGTSGNNMDHLCIRITPFDEKTIQETLDQHGIAHSEVASRYGADGYGPSIYISDPDGNTVELKGPPDDAND